MTGGNVKGTNFSISNDVFTQFPGYVRGVVLAYGVKNGDSSGELISLLRGAEERLWTATEFGNNRGISSDSSWREAYRSFGAKPRSSGRR